MTLRRARHLGNPAGNLGPRDDQLRFAAAGALRLVEGLQERRHVVAVDRLHVPADRLEPAGGVFALRLRRHRVERDVVRVVDQDQIVEPLVPGELDRLHRHALLHAAVAGQADDVMIEDRVLGRVEARRRHLPGHGHADGVAHALSEGTRGRLDSRRLPELGMPGGDAVQRAELLHLLERNIVAAQVQPGVEEHAAVSGGENETVPIEPAGLLRIVRERVPEQHGADIGGAERETEMTGGTRGHRVDRETAGLGCRLGEKVGFERHENGGVTTTGWPAHREAESQRGGGARGGKWPRSCSNMRAGTVWTTPETDFRLLPPGPAPRPDPRIPRAPPGPNAHPAGCLGSVQPWSPTLPSAESRRPGGRPLPRLASKAAPSAAGASAS